MELWGWLIGYVALFVLLHLLLYYYYVRRGGNEPATRPSLADGNYATGRYGTGTERSRIPEDPDFESIPNAQRSEQSDACIECSQCGAPNDRDRTFTYCWNCVSMLGR